jgi:glutamate dehydrogenase
MPARNDEINALDGKVKGEVQLKLYAAVQDLLHDRDLWILRVADRTKKSIAAIVATYFAAEAYFRIDRVVAAARSIVVSDYFDRLAFDRALDSIGDAERRLTAAMVETGQTGEAAVAAWIKPRQVEVERLRSAIHQIAGSGLTLSKLTVTASLLGDLAKN